MAPETNSEHPGNCIVRKASADRYDAIKVGEKGREVIRKDASFDYAVAKTHLAGGRVWYQEGDLIELFKMR